MPQPQPGDPSVTNTWGTLENTGRTLIDAAVGSTLSLSVAGNSNVVLTVANGAADQSRHMSFILTGTLTGNIDVLYPQGGCELFTVFNGTTGAFTLGAGANDGTGNPAGTVISIPQGGRALLISDGTNVHRAVDTLGMGAAASGANSDITSLAGLTTPLSAPQGGTGRATLTNHGVLVGAGTAGVNPTAAGTSGYALLSNGASADPTFQQLPAAGLAAIANGTMLANESGASASPSATVIPVLNEQLITSNGSFTIPAAATTATVFRFHAIGGGGGGGAGTTSSGAAGAGGMAGSEVIADFSGFTAGQTVTVSVGGGATSANTGGDTTLTYAATSIVVAKGGLPGNSSPDASRVSISQGNRLNANVATAGATGLALAWTNVISAQAPGGYGQAGYSNATTGCSGGGGNSSFGTGGGALCIAATTGNGGSANGLGAGGAGGMRGGSDVTGGTGGNGAVLVSWVL
jgi:hypothetical protein